MSRSLLFVLVVALCSPLAAPGCGSSRPADRGMDPGSSGRARAERPAATSARSVPEEASEEGGEAEEALDDEWDEASEEAPTPASAPAPPPPPAPAPKPEVAREPEPTPDPLPEEDTLLERLGEKVARRAKKKSMPRDEAKAPAPARTEAPGRLGTMGKGGGGGGAGGGVLGGAAPDSTGEPVYVSRHPALEAPPEVYVGERFPLMVWLSVDPITAGVEIRTGPRSRKDEDGQRVQLQMPAPPPGATSWMLDVVLMAPGFEIVAGGFRGSIELPIEGDSTPALFELVARPVSEDQVERKLTATLWHEGQYLARISRGIVVIAPGKRARKTTVIGRRVGAAAALVGRDSQVADLTMRVEYDDPGALGAGRVVVTSPHFKTPIVLGDIDTSADLVPFLHTYYTRFMDAEQGRGAGEGADATIPLMRGFGRELYRRFAPDAFKQAFCALAGDSSVAFETIQIYANNPTLPWELMRPTCPGGGEHDFLAVAFTVARWHVSDAANQLERPLQELALGHVVTIAPAYEDGVLPHQAQELAVLAGLPGYERLPGNRRAVRGLLQRLPKGVVHFAGHGEIQTTRGGVPEYAIKLEDGLLDLMTWRGLVGQGADARHPFFFFNACDLGQAHQVASFVEGWAPAVLDVGASGYVGGLWPLDDEAAAQFAARFYQQVTRELAEGPVVVAEVLRDTRRRFFATGDPTFLAYVYYGDVNLRFVD